MMEIKNNIFWIGTIQDLGKPYADLYLDKETNSLFLFVRVTKSTDQDARFAAISVNPVQVSDYMESKLPMAEVFSELPFRFASIKDHTVTFEGGQHMSSPSIFQYNQPFDPLLCVNKTKLKLVLRKLQQWKSNETAI